MREFDIKTTSTIELANYLDKATKKQDQSLINRLAYELAYRVYIPNTKVSFDDLLNHFGYKRIEKEQNKSKIFIKKR